MTGKIGVILANTGSPAQATPRAVKRYLSQFLIDPHIRPIAALPWWFILHVAILPRRSKVTAQKYQQIWTNEGAPLLVYMDALARGLTAVYQEVGLDACVVSAMSYGKPSIKQAVRKLKDAGCTEMVVLPLFPQTAYSTTLTVKKDFERAVRHYRFKGAVHFVDGYAENPVYIKALAARIRSVGFDEARGDRLLFSYHSIPLKDIEAGDTYELQVDATSLAIASELNLDRKTWTISYQCRFDKERLWLAPFTKPTLERLARTAETGSRLFMVCPNFSCDCLETLFDIPFELEPAYREALSQQNDESFQYVPCLNRSKAHVKVLLDVLTPWVPVYDS